MPLDGTYSGLQASIMTWLDDSSSPAAVPDFITLAEMRLNDRLRFGPMERQITLATSLMDLTAAGVLIDPGTGAILTETDPVTGDILTETGSGSSVRVSATPLPSDFMEMRSVRANTSPSRTLRLSPPDWASTQYGGLSGWPDIYTIIGPVLAVYPQTAATLSLIYYSRIPALSDANPTNWLLASRPQLYLYAALLEASPFLLDDNRAEMWRTYLEQAITDAESADGRMRWGNATMRLPGPSV